MRKRKCKIQNSQRKWKVERQAKLFSTFCLLFLLSLIFAAPLGAVRIKDIARMQNPGEIQLIGYGLVVGLDGTGDRMGAQFTTQSVANLIKRMGISVSPTRLRTRNVAAVMVTAKLGPFAKVGNKVDVTVSSIGDASSLEGGTLLLTELSYKGKTVYVEAQGPLSVGGFTAEAGVFGERTSTNYTLVGRVPGGGVVVRKPPVVNTAPTTLFLSLLHSDYTTADRIAKAINQKFGEKLATPLDASTTSIQVPSDRQDTAALIDFVSQIETIQIVPDTPARVVINERTGTIIIGQNVTVSPVAIASGNLHIEIKATPVISQPPPFSKGETVVVPEMQITAESEKARVIALEEAASVSDIAKALNALGATPRDIIAIFQALKEAGALHGELVII
ncbi:MAG: flagellar basal body P-ring protein FlgI [Candidatus Latescibacteria bacterium]|nr:flagellar basal body P-ring protein FlgI [Candidatus Latescibacterota bacterium]